MNSGQYGLLESHNLAVDMIFARSTLMPPTIGLTVSRKDDSFTPTINDCVGPNNTTFRIALEWRGICIEF